jgi:hypothetical protein
MTSTRRAGSSGPVLHPRVCAVLTVFSCLIHLWIAGSGQHGPWLNLLMVGVAAICMPCAVHIWRHSSVQDLRRVTSAALAMVALHSVLLFGSGGGHSHSGMPVTGLAEASGATQLLLVIGLELLSALISATLVARLRLPAGQMPGRA